MSRSDFHFELDNKTPHLDETIIERVEERLRSLAQGQIDLIGAAAAVEELAPDETPHTYQARVVAYTRPSPIAAVEKSDTPDTALRGALDAVERQIRARRLKFREFWQQPEQATNRGVYELSAREIYQSFVAGNDPADLLALDRTELAARIMLNYHLDQEAAYFAADQIQSWAQELAPPRQ